jgi:hypothetical protein
VRTLHAILACLITLAAAPAAAQRARVEITVEGLFGEGTLLQDGYLPVLVTVESRTRVPLSGELELTLASYEGDIARHRARLDLPPRATRQIVMTLFTHSSGTHLNAAFETDQQVEGETTRGVDYSPGGRSIVVRRSAAPAARSSIRRNNLRLVHARRAHDGALRSGERRSDAAVRCLDGRR